MNDFKYPSVSLRNTLQLVDLTVGRSKGQGFFCGRTVPYKNHVFQRGQISSHAISAVQVWFHVSQRLLGAEDIWLLKKHTRILENSTGVQQWGFWRWKQRAGEPSRLWAASFSVPDPNNENIPQLSVNGFPPVEPGPGLKPHWDSPDVRVQTEIDLHVVSADTPLADRWRMQWFVTKRGGGPQPAVAS